LTASTLSNLALLCRRHHRAVHEEGYRLDRHPDGALTFRRPDGRLVPEVPPPVALPADPIAVLRARHEAQGLPLHAKTTRPSWLGERLDVGYAIDVLHPLATHEATLRRAPAGDVPVRASAVDHDRAPRTPIFAPHAPGASGSE
jgi:hypothetical protein